MQQSGRPPPPLLPPGLVGHRVSGCVLRRTIAEPLFDRPAGDRVRLGASARLDHTAITDPPIGSHDIAHDNEASVALVRTRAGKILGLELAGNLFGAPGQSSARARPASAAAGAGA